MKSFLAFIEILFNVLHVFRKMLQLAMGILQSVSVRTTTIH